ncbi:MAG: type II toxin-antitoxin system HicA family toxin [bacterium]
MPKIPRNISAKKLINLLKKYNYKVTRQTGSHIRLSSILNNIEHKITIPDHDYIKIGTLNNILDDVAFFLKISKEDLINGIFEK